MERRWGSLLLVLVSAIGFGLLLANEPASADRVRAVHFIVTGHGSTTNTCPSPGCLIHAEGEGMCEQLGGICDYNIRLTGSTNCGVNSDGGQCVWVNQGPRRPGVITVANGDELRATIGGTASEVGPPGSALALNLVLNIEGGTGQFEDAKGSANAAVTVDPITGQNFVKIEGAMVTHL